MALTEKTEVDKCEVLSNGVIQARTALVIERDGVEISRKYINRKVYHPGEDVSNAPDMVKKIAEVEHTDAAITAFAEARAAGEARRLAMSGG
jgi:ribosomal protein S24E|tara:strand:+ start:243 stop:518 length:276 start_codon:yes stop_codon:yes gene_type:complete